MVCDHLWVIEDHHHHQNCYVSISLSKHIKIRTRERNRETKREREREFNRKNPYYKGCFYYLYFHLILCFFNFNPSWSNQLHCFNTKNYIRLKKQNLYEAVSTMRDDNLKKSKVCFVVIMLIGFTSNSYAFCFCYVLFNYVLSLLTFLFFSEAFMAQNFGQEMV